jgi:hypothetical protein
MSKTVTIHFTRSKIVTEQGSATFELDDPAAVMLQDDAKQLDAWAKFSAIRDVKNWTSPPPIALLEWTVTYEARWADKKKGEAA